MTSHSERVLIFGIDSFTGYHLQNHLKEKGYGVFGTVITKNAEKPCYFCDIMDAESICPVISDVKPDYIIHLSAISFTASRNFSEFYQINVIGAENMLNAVVESGLRPVVIMPSSATVYGNLGGELHEGLCPDPVNHYGISKLAMEQIAKTFFDKLPIIITRPFNYTGYNQNERFVIPKIAAAFRNRRQSIELGNINTIREYNDVRMVTDIYERLMRSGKTSECVNICSGRGVSLTDVLETCREITGHEIDVKINPEFIRKNEIFSLTGSDKKLKSLIGGYNIYTLEELLRTML